MPLQKYNEGFIKLRICCTEFLNMQNISILTIRIGEKFNLKVILHRHLY